MKDERINLKVDKDTKEELEKLKVLYGFSNQRDLVRYLLLVFNLEVKENISMSKHLHYINLTKEKEI